MVKAENVILKLVQREEFGEEYKCLSRPTIETPKSIPETTAQVKKSSRILRLDPVLHGNLIRVGGRQRKVNIPEEAKQQIILPKNHHISKLLIEYYHCLAGHSGTQHVLSLLRQKYWVIHGNSAVHGTYPPIVLYIRNHPLLQLAWTALAHFMFVKEEAQSSVMVLFSRALPYAPSISKLHSDSIQIPFC